MKETEPQQLSASGRPLPKQWLAIIATIWAGQAVSMLTSYAAGFAAIWYVTETTGSALMLSLMAICAYLPMGLLSPFGGVIADKFNRRNVMIIADLCVGIVSLILGIAVFLGQASLVLIMIMVIARSAGQAFHGPAMMAAMPMLVPNKHLMRINTLDQMLISICSIGAPAFGILLYTALGFHSVMFLDFVGALIAVGALLLVKIPKVHDLPKKDQHVIANLVEGWRAFASNRGLLFLLIGLGLGMFAFGPVGALFPLMTYDHFGGDGYMASLVEAVFGVGMIIGSGILMAWGGGKRLALLMVIAAIITGLLTAACGFLTPSMFIVFVVLSGLMAITCSWFNAPTITIVQRNVPEEKMGRALGFTNAVFGLVPPLGVALGGLAAEAYGSPVVFVVSGLMMAAAGIFIYSFKAVRALDKNELPTETPLETVGELKSTQPAESPSEQTP